jgi:hypothetical protein
MRKSALAIAFAASVLGTAPGHTASQVWDPGVDACTTLNCGTVLLPGTVGNIAGLSTQRWDIAVYAAAGECLRLDQTNVFGAGVDDEMVVVAPDGTAYRDDDSSGGLRPKVVINPTPSRGWYYVSIARFTGAPAPEHDFYLKYGRYVRSTTNPNCVGATTPRMEPAPALGSKTPTAVQQAPAASPTAQ